MRRMARSSGALMGLGLVLAVLFFGWLAVAAVLSQLLVPELPTDPTALARVLFTTDQGRMLLVWANLAAFVFAVTAFVSSLIAVPLLVDRDVDMVSAF